MGPSGDCKNGSPCGPCLPDFHDGMTTLHSVMPTKFILWDVMDTLVHDPFRDAMPAFFGMPLNELLQEKHPTAWARFETGELNECGFLSEFFRDGRKYDQEGFKACVRSAYRWINGMQSMLSVLHEQGVHMHTLSNYPEWYLWIEQELGLSRYLSWSFVSCLTTLRKPDPAAYRHAAQTLACEPRECLFIDDRVANCDAARALGMAAIHFTGNIELLWRELEAAGVADRSSSPIQGWRGG